MDLSFDVIVIGAGPAGLATGYVLEKIILIIRSLRRGNLPKKEKRTIPEI